MASTLSRSKVGVFLQGILKDDERIQVISNRELDGLLIMLQGPQIVRRNRYAATVDQGHWYISFREIIY